MINSSIAGDEILPLLMLLAVQNPPIFSYKMPDQKQ